MVNEIEFHPGYTQPYVTEFCRKNGIVLEGWSPIGRGRLLRLPLLREMGARYGKVRRSCASASRCKSGVLPLPKSSSRARMLENLDVFDFTLSKKISPAWRRCRRWAGPASTRILNAGPRSWKQKIAERKN